MAPRAGVERVLSAIPIQSNKYGECVRQHRADPAKALVALGSAMPKALAPPFREIRNPQTTTASVGAFLIKQALPESELARAFATGLRTAGRAA